MCNFTSRPVYKEASVFVLMQVKAANLALIRGVVRRADHSQALNRALWLPALSRRSRRPATFRPSFVELDQFCFDAPDAIRGAVMVPSHHFSLVPPRELKEAPHPPSGASFFVEQ